MCETIGPFLNERIPTKNPAFVKLTLDLTFRSRSGEFNSGHEKYYGYKPWLLLKPFVMNTLRRVFHTPLCCLA